VNALEIIGRKRDGEEHSAAELRELLADYLDGSLPDYQMAAWLMAVCTRGMTRAETLALTQAMVDSGEVLDLSSLPGIKVDKHSTGGVGDKVTLVAGPLAAACGVRVPKLSGRALAHTGGTLDKLESVPGLTVDLAPDRFLEQVRRVGLAVAAQAGAQLVVLELNTPGGLDDAMRRITGAMLRSPVPVVVYVTPAGGRAGPAGEPAIASRSP